MKIKNKPRDRALRAGLKSKIIELLSHDDEAVNLQAGQVILSLEVETVTDFISGLMIEFQDLLAENQRLMDQSMRDELRRDKSESHATRSSTNYDIHGVIWNE